MAVDAADAVVLVRQGESNFGNTVSEQSRADIRCCSRNDDCGGQIVQSPGPIRRHLRANTFVNVMYRGTDNGKLAPAKFR
jgi:hypothetical protein